MFLGKYVSKQSPKDASKLTAMPPEVLPDAPTNDAPDLAEAAGVAEGSGTKGEKTRNLPRVKTLLSKENAEVRHRWLCAYKVANRALMVSHVRLLLPPCSIKARLQIVGIP